MFKKLIFKNNHNLIWQNKLSKISQIAHEEVLHQRLASPERVEQLIREAEEMNRTEDIVKHSD